MNERLSVSQASYTVASDLKPLISIALPNGSAKNIVHCSPGCPSKRNTGPMTNCRPRALSRCANACQSGNARNHAKVRHRHHVLSDLAGACGRKRLTQMQRDLLAEKVVVDPGGRTAAFRAAERVAIESAGCVKVANVEGEVEDAVVHSVPDAMAVNGVAVTGIAPPGRRRPLRGS